MDMSLRVVPLHLHPLGLIESFIHFGADIDHLLANTRIEKRMLYDRERKISYFQLNTLIRNGIKACKTPGLGLLIGSHMDWSHQGPVGSAINCSPSLKDALDAYFRFFCIAQPFHLNQRHERSFFVDPKGIVVFFIFAFGPTEGDASLQLFETEFQLASVLRLCQCSGNKTVNNTAVSVSLSYAKPSHLSLYNSLPCSDLAFSCERSSISAHKDFVIKPWRDLRRAAYQAAIKNCEGELLGAGIELSFAARVRWHISSNYFQHPISVENTAKQLRVTPRSLARKLAKENTSFRNLHHEVRMEITSQHLKYSQLSVEDVAELMRFSSVSSLRRAIKNWSGITVTELRNTVSGQRELISIEDPTRFYRRSMMTEL